MKTKMEWFYTEYKMSDATELHDVYGRWSWKKEESFRKIKQEAWELKRIEPVRILSHNSFNYTCAYIYPHPETGQLVFRVETACNTYEEDLDHD